MRIATLRVDGTTKAALRDGDKYRLLDFEDVGALIRANVDWSRLQGSREIELNQADYAPTILEPRKIFCLGLNYREHIAEMGRADAGYPTLFCKFAQTLMGANDDLVLPAISQAVDWEAELGVVIKDETRNVSESEANDHIAGFVVVNDVSMRDFQNRTTQFMQGKIFEGTTPVGPELVTPDEVDFARDLRITTTIDGEVMQDSRTSRLIFSIPEVISYISSIITLSPGDLISTGTPSGVGAGRVPKVFLKSGQRLVTTVEGVGELVNLVR